MFPENHDRVVTTHVLIFNDFSKLCDLQGEEKPNLERQLVMRNLEVNTNYNETNEDNLILEQSKIMNKQKGTENERDISARADFQLNICDSDADTWKPQY